jgi:ActR/RegA family two-component response regulator
MSVPVFEPLTVQAFTIVNAAPAAAAIEKPVKRSGGKEISHVGKFFLTCGKNISHSPGALAWHRRANARRSPTRLPALGRLTRWPVP